MAESGYLALRKFVAPEFVFGDGASALAGQYARNLGARRVLVVSDPGVAAAGLSDGVLETLTRAGIAWSLFAEVSSNPRDREVAAGAALYREADCDAIVAVGGGSPMDCAKGIGIVVASGKDILSFEGVDKVDRPSPPLVCVPTTAGSSADVSQFAIITSSAERRKIAIVSKMIIPDVALVDPRTTLSMGPELTAATGMDALTHAVEAYVSNAHSPVTDMHALESARLIARGLPLVMERPDDLEQRARVMLGSLLAGLAFSNAILGAVHGMAHSLGGWLDLPHGACNAILLDPVLAWNYEAAPGRVEELGRALGLDLPPGPPSQERKVAVVEVVRGFKRGLGFVSRLGDLGVTKADIPALARAALSDPCMVTNPRVPTLEDIERLYEEAI